LKVNGKTVVEKNNVKGLVKHENVKFFASDKFYSPSNVNLSKINFAYYEKDKSKCIVIYSKCNFKGKSMKVC